MLPSVGKNAISPFLKSVLLRSIPELIPVSKYIIDRPIWCTFPSKGNILAINPTVIGERWRFNLHLILSLPLTSKITLILETVPEHISRYPASRIYNRFQSMYWLSESIENVDEINNDAEIIDNSVEDAVTLYRKVRESKNKEPTEKEIADIEKECEIIRNRQVITKDLQHKPVEITNKNGLVVTGPPTLTRFEKARIMGARALQLSLGAPIFIEIPKNATTSLEIAMEELKQRVIPIVIKRTLPNGDYQNIPIDQFA